MQSKFSKICHYFYLREGVVRGREWKFPFIQYFFYFLASLTEPHVKTVLLTTTVVRLSRRPVLVVHVGAIRPGKHGGAFPAAQPLLCVPDIEILHELPLLLCVDRGQVGLQHL